MGAVKTAPEKQPLAFLLEEKRQCKTDRENDLNIDPDVDDKRHGYIGYFHKVRLPHHGCALKKPVGVPSLGERLSYQ
ncbi:MAG: hypothetical protein KDJ77_08355 [Rhodobiaceae bacterium]|nr:hypothetical protein [Rhodobiaceae bacterium]